MSEENKDNIDPAEEPQEEQQEPVQEWEAPPIPEQIEADEKEEPEMSEVATLGNVFIEPGRTFEDLRRKPRWIIAFVIFAVALMGFSIAFQQKVGEDAIRRFIAQQQDRSPQMQSASEDQKRQGVEFALTIQKVATYAMPIFILFSFLIGGLFYWVGTKMMGGTARFTHGLSVFAYSTFAPGLVSTVANFIVLLIKPAEEIDIASSQRGLINANPTMFLDGKEMPVLATVISNIDLFVIWGLVLAAIGLRKVAGISAGSAWAIVLVLNLILLAFRVLGAYFNGVPS
ncbi:MAG: YIP1 family protein [Acidobacteria bacterium]|nr:MAG: YIP1 family protein [Acidobacteriota bacterium]REK01362.1 MAG: YIP1 family protein [Acidobacteriota bacterium]REK14318.1 MAG: YIP1 family protein [Acidobacteriota bacterium]REK45033.1 MAG: YIP1 family protein [Acidobacteriota bacterium]